MKFYPISLIPPEELFQEIQKQSDLPSLLFQRTAQMEGLQKEFAKIMLMPAKKRDKWVKAHQDFIHDMLAKIRHESHLMVKDFAFDQNAKSTVTEYMVTVQQTLATLEKVVYDGEEPQID